MKHLLLTTIAAVLLVGCGNSQQSAPAPETQPAEPVAEVPTPPLSPPPEAELAEPVAEAAQPEPSTQKELHKKSCYNQLKRIDGVKEMWATMEKRAVGYFPTEAQIGDSFRDGVPSCPGGGVYTIGAVGNQASCSIHGKLARPDIQTRDEKPVATGNINPEMPRRSIPRRPRRIPQR